MATEASVENKVARRVRWRAPLVIVVLTGIALGLIAFAPDWLRGMQVLASMVVLGAAAVALLVWFTMFSRLSRRTRSFGMAALAVLVLASVACVRVDGFDGQMLPIFAWRWTPTAE